MCLFNHALDCHTVLAATTMKIGALIRYITVHAFTVTGIMTLHLATVHAMYMESGQEVNRQQKSTRPD